MTIASEPVDRPAKEWTREQRIEWASAKFGDAAPYYWIIYRVNANRARAKIDEYNGLAPEEIDTYVASRHGAGTFWRELKIRGNNTTGAIVSEEFGIDPGFAGSFAGAGAMGSARIVPTGYPHYPMAQRMDPSMDRLDRLERLFDRLMDRVMTPAVPQAPAMGVQEVIALAAQLSNMRAATPMDELAKMKKLAEELYRQSRRGRHDEDDEDDEDSGGVGGLGRVAGQFLEFLNRQPATPSAAPTPAPAPGLSPPPTPNAPNQLPSSGVVERFPGARTLATALRANAALLPTVIGRDGAEFEPIVQAAIEAIEESFGDPYIVASRLGANGIAEGILEHAPELGAHRALLTRAGEVFVASVTREEDNNG